MLGTPTRASIQRYGTSAHARFTAFAPCSLHACVPVACLGLRTATLSLPLSQYFEGNPRHIVSRMLEIGLGCTMAYGPGASSKLWRWYFPQVPAILSIVRLYLLPVLPVCT